MLTGGRGDDDVDATLDDEPAPSLTSRMQLPSPKAFGGRLVQALSEASAGERPLAQLSPYFSRPVYHRLERHFATTLRGTGAQAGPDNKANVRSVHVCEPSDGVAEVAAVVRRGARMAADRPATRGPRRPLAVHRAAHRLNPHRSTADRAPTRSPCSTARGGLGVRQVWAVPQSDNAWSTGSSVRPASVRVYSTRGGTSA